MGVVLNKFDLYSSQTCEMSSSKRPHAYKDICHAQGPRRPAEVTEGTKQVPSADWVTHRPRASAPVTAVGARGTQT